MKPLRSLIIPALTVFSFVLCAAASAETSFEGLPQEFKVGPMGGLTCVGMTEDACAYYDEVPTPAGVRYLVQGSYSRKPDPSRVHLNSVEYVNTYFALLCDREGDSLKPVFSFLEGREKASDLHFHDLDADGTPEIIVTGIFDSRGSYASVYRLTGSGPERVFTRRANTPNSDFETDHGVPALTFQQRDGKGAASRLRTETFVWNGRTFVPES
jgi:hypothetical protein